MHPYIPVAVNGPIQDIKITDEILYWYPWIVNLKNKNTYLHLHAAWKLNGDLPDTPPSGYDYYITSGDSLMYKWPEKISKSVNGKIIHLISSMRMDAVNTDQIKFITYNHAHRRITRIPRPVVISKNIKYKASALTNRVTQSKAIVFSALTSCLSKQDFVGSLNYNHNLLKNVHNWEMSGNAMCDKHTKNFIDNWLDKKVIMPNDDQIEGSYNNPAYLNSALNFTQESYHYSYMADSTGHGYIEPGPFVTEKTWKCLVSKTAFIPVGQMFIYHWLKMLGLKFEYGELDLDFDNDPGNLTRLEKIINLIESLYKWSAMDLYEMTRASTEYNYDYVQSQDFWNFCEYSNTETYNYLANLS
jgi:hypothetical protein